MHPTKNRSNFKRTLLTCCVVGLSSSIAMSNASAQNSDAPNRIPNRFDPSDSDRVNTTDRNITPGFSESNNTPTQDRTYPRGQQAIQPGVSGSTSQGQWQPNGLSQQNSVGQAGSTDSPGRRGQLQQSSSNRPTLGVAIEDSQEGVRVLAVQQGSAAAQAGLQQGDVILEVSGQAVQGSSQLADRIQSMTVGQSVQMVVLRNGEEQTVTAQLKASQRGNMGQAHRGGDMGRGEMGRGEMGLANQSTQAEIRQLREEVRQLQQQVHQLMQYHQEASSSQQDKAEGNSRSENGLSRERQDSNQRASNSGDNQSGKNQGTGSEPSDSGNQNDSGE